MAYTNTGIVLGKHLDIVDSFVVDESAKKIKVKKGLKSAVLEGSTLNITTLDDAVIAVPLAGLIPAAKADKFLKTVSYSSGTKELVFTVGNDLNATTEEVKVSVADFLPVVAGNGLQGNGTTESPLSIKVDPAGSNALTSTANGLKLDANALKPIATVELVDVFGERIGYALTETERRAS